MFSQKRKEEDRVSCQKNMQQQSIHKQCVDESETKYVYH